MAALWTLLSLMALAFALGYLFFTLSLNSASDVTFERLAHLPPNETPSVLIASPPAPTPPPIEVETPRVVDPPKIVEPRQPSRLKS